MEEILDLINEKNEVIGKASRKEIEEKGLLYRCSGIYVQIGKKIVIEQRSHNKKIRPLNFSIVEETVKTGETFEEAAVRGVKEELGLDVQDLKELGVIHIQDKEYNDNFLLNFFLAKGIGKLLFDSEEVENIELKSIEEVEQLFSSGKKISPGFLESFKHFKKAIK
ncbi:MAG: NUDIX domain-containing protein [archaeon]|nr:NUDIX domain-containing protein [archaeon]